MVNFNWGKQTLSLPRSASFIETQMKDYVLNGDKEFRRKMRKAIESVEDSEPNSAALKSELTKILEHNDFHFVDFNKLYFFKTNRWDLLYKNKITIKLPTNDLGKSIGLLKNIIKSLDINKIKIIDLRIKNNVILS